MIARITSNGRLQGASDFADFVVCGGDAKEFMKRFHPEDAVIINDMAFVELYKRGPRIYPVSQADADCLPFLALCSTEFVIARKEMGQSLLRAFDALVQQRSW